MEKLKLIIIIALITPTLSLFSQRLTNDSNTLLLLHFDGSSQGVNGEVPTTANSISYATGIDNQCIATNSTTQLQYPVLSNIQDTMGTIECWIKPNWSGTSNYKNGILFFGNNQSNISLRKAGQNLKFSISKDPQNSVIVASGISNWLSGDWHHVAATWGQGMVQLYIDGSKVGSSAYSFSIPNLQAIDMFIGSGNNYWDRLDGSLDEFRISNTIRSENEIFASFYPAVTLSGINFLKDSIIQYPTWKHTPEFLVTTNFGSASYPSHLINWSSADTTIAKVDSNGKITSVSGGSTFVIATKNGVSDSIKVFVITPPLAVEYTQMDSFLTHPHPKHVKEVPVVIIRYIPTADGINTDVSKIPRHYSLVPQPLVEVKDNIDEMDIQVKFMLEERTKYRGYKDPNARPYLGYKVVKYITVYEQTPPGKILKYKSGYPIYMADFHQIFERFNIEHYVNDLGVSEIWFWSAGLGPTMPSYDPAIHKPEDFRAMWESNMSSPVSRDYSNSIWDETDLPKYNTTYVVYGQNYWRSVGEAVHNHGHQSECELHNVNFLQDGNKALFGEKFVGRIGSNQPIGRAGDTHHPPNTTQNYDYNNDTLVASDIEDWKPFGGPTKLVNKDTWGDLTFQWPYNNPPPEFKQVECRWYIYWWQNMPGFGNRIRYGSNYLTNWWVFTADWDSSIINGVGLYAGVPSPAADLGMTPYKSNITCFNANDGQIQLIVSGGELPYTYSWSTGDTISDINNLPAGIYKITVTDSMNNTIIDSIIIYEPLKMETVAIVQHDIDNNCDGNVTIQVSGGTVPYMYNWIGLSETGSSLSGLCSGTYIYNVYDKNNCTSTDTINILNKPAIIISFDKTDISCFGLNDGEIDVSVTGGEPPYSYSWSNSETIEDVKNLSAGKYKIIITDMDARQKTDSIIIIEPDKLQLETSIIHDSNSACKGSALAIVDGGTSPYTYQWDDPGLQTTATASGLCGGSYIIEVKDSRNCSIQEVVIIQILTSINENNIDDKTTIYPNPITSGQLFIDFSGITGQDIDLKIVDELGRTFISKIISSNKDIEKISIPSIGRGFYVLTLTFEDGKNIIRKLMVY